MSGCPDPEINLQVAVASDCIPAEKDFSKWFRIITELSDIKGKTISIRLVDTAESAVLNHKFRGKDSATNVLSFPSEVPDDIEPDYLGDIVICGPVVEREATAQDKAVQAHWAHMLVHGVLHLLGFDHQNEKQAGEMEAMEAKILSEIGFLNPYED